MRRIAFGWGSFVTLVSTCVALGLAWGALALSAGISAASDLQPPGRDYFAYVCAESEDLVHLIRFGPGGIEILKSIPVGIFPAEIEGPHGINVSADGRFWFVSVAHGQPFGTIHKYSTGDDEWDGDATVGMFPATLDVSRSTGLLFVVNSDFYGDHAPSTISVVETRSMSEVAQIDTGAMPHGARLDAKGAKLYSVNMMDDDLVEVDALRFEMLRRLALDSSGAGALDAAGAPSLGHEAINHGSMDHSTDPAGKASADSAKGHAEMDHDKMDSATLDHAMSHGDMPHSTGTETEAGEMADPSAQVMKTPTVEPSWVSAPTASGKLYVTALSGNQIIEVDLDSWKVTRRFETPKGPYNLAVTADEKLLVVTYKKSNAVGFWNLEAGKEIARIETTRRIPHGVAITPDDRYSLVTVEGVGGEPGLVEVFDNAALERVAILETGKQAGGIAIWEPPQGR